MGFNLDSYETVQDRLIRFWEKHPNGSIRTRFFFGDEELIAGRALFCAEVFRDIGDAQPAGTGYAYEEKSQSGVNKDSHVENAETSAIGRALANCNFASEKHPRPSRQEMEKVERMAETNADPIKREIDELRERYVEAIRAKYADGVPIYSQDEIDAFKKAIGELNIKPDAESVLKLRSFVLALEEGVSKKIGAE